MTPDEIFLDAPEGRRVDHTIVFITGNPGLIGYYQLFLASVHQRANKLSQKGVAVCGQSLGGFEVNHTPHLHSLEDQVRLVQRRIETLSDRLGGKNNEKLQLTLIGHSVGAYILLRVVQGFYEAKSNGDVRYEIQAGILLFPTIVDIARSASGTLVSWPLAIPFWPKVGGSLAWASAQVFPSAVLRSIVAQSPAFRGLNEGMEQDQAVDTTVAFLKSSLGVTQCVTMAVDEMREIAIDQFNANLWGSAPTEPSRPPRDGTRVKLFFYFGEKDHWVADATRDTLIATRAYAPADPLVERQDWEHDSRPWMEVDQHGTGHGFCISSSDFVAEKVAEYLRIIIEQSL